MNHFIDNIFRGFQKSGTKSRGVLHFVPLRRLYDVLFVPLFCRPREKCGILWKTTWLHNVDNIRQKDIKYKEDFGLLFFLLFSAIRGVSGERVEASEVAWWGWISDEVAWSCWLSLEIGWSRRDHQMAVAICPSHLVIPTWSRNLETQSNWSCDLVTHSIS